MSNTMTNKTITAIIFILVASSSTWLGTRYLFKSDTLPINRIVMLKKLHEQDPMQLQQLANKNMNGGFFSLELESFRKKIEVLPWVDTVSVRKKWPETLQLDIREKKVAARWINSNNDNNRTIKKLMKTKWNDKSLLSDKGKIFNPMLTAVQYKQYGQISLFSSPDNLSKDNLEKCINFSTLLDEVKLKITKCFQDQRRSWFVQLNNGFKLYLGRTTMDNEIDTVNKRMNIFISAYQQVLRKYEKNIKHIDLRYTNGFAIKWKAIQA